MKRLIPLFFLAFLFCSCQNEIKNWVAISVQTDENTTFNRSNYPVVKIWIDTKCNTELTFYYFLLPISDSYIDITDIYSTDPDVVTIQTIDYKKRIITAKAINQGNSKIVIKTKSNSSCTTPIIYVK